VVEDHPLTVLAGLVACQRTGDTSVALVGTFDAHISLIFLFEVVRLWKCRALAALGLAARAVLLGVEEAGAARLGERAMIIQINLFSKSLEEFCLAKLCLIIARNTQILNQAFGVNLTSEHTTLARPCSAAGTQLVGIRHVIETLAS
jgi:hypothetical protein